MILTDSSATHEGAGEEGASDPAEPQQAGEYLDQTQIIIVSSCVINVVICRTFMERKTVIDLRKAVMEVALPRTEPGNKREKSERHKI